MKVIILLTCLTLPFGKSFTFSKYASANFYHSSDDCDSIPPLNQEILDYVKTKMNKKVGSGECAELAIEALKEVGIKYNGKYIFGKVVDYKNECVYPGDIIQFERVKINYTIGDVQYLEEMPHHTAVIYKVNSKGNYVLAQQNYNNRKKVVNGNLELKNITKGKFVIYRPTK